jgi:hypothetical protein
MRFWRAYQSATICCYLFQICPAATSRASAVDDPYSSTVTSVATLAKSRDAPHYPFTQGVVLPRSTAGVKPKDELCSITGLAPARFTKVSFRKIRGGVAELFPGCSLCFGTE